MDNPNEEHKSHGYTIIADGSRYYYEDPKAEQLTVELIANSLAKQCRFGGQLPGRIFYSVARHSLLVASVLPEEIRYLGLMHDPLETVETDIPHPLKVQLEPLLDPIVAPSWEKIKEVHGLPDVFPDEVWEADRLMCLTECTRIWPDYVPGDWFKEGDEPYDPKIILDSHLEGNFNQDRIDFVNAYYHYKPIYEEWCRSFEYVEENEIPDDHL